MSRELSSLIPIFLTFTCLFCISRYVYLDIDAVEFSETAHTYGGYCVRAREFVGKVGEYNRVALILHGSADFVTETFEDQVNNWNAPISLSVYLDDLTHQAHCMLEFFGDLFNRSAVARDYLTVHFVYKPGHEHCEIKARACRRRTEDVPFPTQAEYPANLLRNIARLQHSSKYILIGDFDHLFSLNFEKRMLKLANWLGITKNRAALVYRLFEVEEGEEDPLKKTQLLNLVNQKKAITFHASFIMREPRESELQNPHYIRGEKEWFSKRENESETIIADTLQYDNPKWEPQFVSSSLIPLHDERFPYRIRDNTCLRWEMCRAGYKWLLVDDLFMFHRGVKRYESSSKYESVRIQKIGMPRFHTALEHFEKRLDEEYPSTKDKCPVCRYKEKLAC